MAEVFTGLVILGIFLAFVAVVGHGIWVLAATIFGGNSTRRRREELSHKLSAEGRRVCPRCLTPLESVVATCSVCGWPSPVGQHSNAKAGLSAVREQLNQYARLGVIDEPARDRLLAKIQNEEQLLAERALSAQRTAEANAVAPAPPTFVETPASELPAVSDITTASGLPPGEPATEPTLASAAPVGERARRFAARRADAAIEPSPCPFLEGRGAEGAKPAVPVSRLLAAFMEEKNIRWGELVGGLLIVGCSIALVISFWSEIAARPLLKFGLFNGVTAALFGAGLYTDRRWKIHTTSHGVLMIATLLVPLNFLAIAAFTQASPPTDLLSLAGEAVSLLLFSLLVYLAGRILLPGDAALLVAGVIIPSMMQLIVRRFAEPGMPLAGLYALAGVPIASYLATSVILTRESTVGPPSRGGPDAAVEVPLGSRHLLAHSLLVFLGLVSAATLLPLALLAYRSPPLGVVLQRLSPLVAVSGLPALLVGLVFWRRGNAWGGWGRGSAEPPAASTRGSSAVGGLDPSHPRPESIFSSYPSAGLQTAGIAVGVLGAMIMLAAVVLAWPEPALLLPTALPLAAVMISVAIWFAIPSAYVPAGIALAAAWLIGFYLARGDITWNLNDALAMRQTLVSATSGHALVPLAGIFAALAGWLSRTRRTEDRFFVGLVAASTAAISFGLVMWFGFARTGDPTNATWTLAIYTLAALVTAVVLNRDDIAYVGSALLLATLVQAIVYRYALRSQPGEPWMVWITAILAHSTLATVVGGALQLGQSRKSKKALRALIRSAQVTSLVVAVWIAFTADRASASGLCANLAWLAGVWTLLAAIDKSRLLFALSQTALVLSIICGVTAAVAGRQWYVAARHPWLDSWFLEAQGIALAAYCVLMRGVRSIFARVSRQPKDDAVASSRRNWPEAARQLLVPTWPTMDDVVEVGLVVLVGCVAIYAALPGAAQELTPQFSAGVAPIEEFELAAIPHAHAADRGAWALGAAVLIALSAGLYQAGASWRPIGLLLTASAICPLLAARWEADLAVASALRWFSAGFFALASIGIWTTSGWLGSDGWLGSSRRRAPSELWEYNTKDVLRHARDALVALVVLLYISMGAYVAQATIYRAAIPSGFSWLWLYAGLWAVVVAVSAFAIPRAARRKPHNLQGGLDRASAWLVGAREALWVAALTPLAILFTFAVARALDQYPIAGPLPSSWFRRIGWDVSYGVPLAIIGLVFIGYAIRDRSSGFAFSAGLLFNSVATIVVLLRLARGSGALDATAWIVVTQINAIVAGIVAIVWLAAITLYLGRERSASRRPGTRQNRLPDARLDPGTEPSPAPSLKGRGMPLLLVTQVFLAAAVCAMYLVPAVLRLVGAPAGFTWAIAANGALGWSAVALAIAAAFWIAWGRAISVNRLGIPVAGLVALVALTAAHWDNGDWLAYHTLLAGACAAAWLLPVASVLTNRVVAGLASTETIAWSAPAARLFGLAAVLLAAWGYSGDPASPWWTLAALVAITARAVWIAWCERRPHFMWIAAVLFLPAASIFWLDWASQFSSIAGIGGIGQVYEFLWINVLAAALLALVSVWVMRRWMALHSIESNRQTGIAFHRFAAWAIVATLLLTTVTGLVADQWSQSFPVTMPLAWAAWLAALAAALACWWDPGVRWPVACLYCVGLVGVGIYLDGLNFAAPMFHWALALALSAYSLATSALWSARDKLAAVARRCGLPAASTSGHGWLVSANIVLGVCALVLVSWIETTMPEFGRRMFAAYAIGAQALAIGLLARGAVRTSLQYLALIWGVLFAVAFAWAWLPPDFQAPWLHRLVLAVVALVAMVIVYGFGILKFVRGENEWTRAAARLVPPLSAIAAALIMLVLAIEVSTYLRSPVGALPIVMPAVVAVGLSLVALAIAALMAALVPGRDPLGLSERGRTLYVYAAEGLAGLLFLHIRVTMPWLFRGWFIQFWPLVVMGIAFVGVGFGELFERTRKRVLSEPLHNTGVLLPLLPAIGFWILPSLPSRVDYSLLLLSIGVLYTAMSVLRQSFWYAVLAALAANGSLWYWLYRREGFGLVEHPQMWLIPPALCALAAGYINRERLSAQQSAALRYAAAIVIYASSTADVFIHGVANAPWLPAVLAGLSILGVLAGILLRVRAFLYLGTTFLVVALMTVIWHAAIHERHTWILWVAGIITGTLIIAMFGLFEKRRDDVLRVVEQLKQWEA